MVVVNEMLGFTVSVVLLTLFLALLTASVVLLTLSLALLTASVVLLTQPVALLTLPVVHVLAEGCADIRVLVIVVGISSLEVDKSLQGQLVIFSPVGDLLNLVMLDLLV